MRQATGDVVAAPTRRCWPILITICVVELDEPLPSRARFLGERAARERAQGPTWSPVIPDNIRARLRDALLSSVDGGIRARTALANEARAILESHSEHSAVLVNAETLFTFSRSPAELVDVLDATGIALVRLAERLDGTSIRPLLDDSYEYRAEEYFAKANDILLEGRVSYTYIRGRLKERGAEPLHTDVLRPAEAALTSDPSFANAESAYQDALTAMASGHYGASITSAGSALQQTLVALGAEGQNLGALMSDAKRRGFLMGHDEKLVSAYKAIADWITADRSNRGTAHAASSSGRADAELAIHVVASLIVRLAKLRASKN